MTTGWVRRNIWTYKYRVFGENKKRFDFSLTRFVDDLLRVCVRFAILSDDGSPVGWLLSRKRTVRVYTRKTIKTKRKKKKPRSCVSSIVTRYVANLCERLLLLFGRSRRRHHYYNTDPVPTGRRGRSLVRAFGRDRLSLRRSVPRAVSVLPSPHPLPVNDVRPSPPRHRPPTHTHTPAAAETFYRRRRRRRHLERENASDPLARAPLPPHQIGRLSFGGRRPGQSDVTRTGGGEAGVKGTREGHRIPPDTNRSGALSGFYERGGTHTPRDRFAVAQRRQRPGEDTTAHVRP